MSVATSATDAALSAPTGGVTSSAHDVPIRLVAGVQDASLRAADGAELSVPSRMGRKALRDLLHHLLGLSDGGPDFHFLAPGGVALRTTLGKFIERRGLSTETALVLTYFLPLPKPERDGHVGASKEWLGGLDVFEGGDGVRIVVGSFSGCPSVVSPSDIIVEEEGLRLEKHAAPVKAVAWLSGGEGFVTAGQDEVAKLWSYSGDSARVQGVFRSGDVAKGTPFESVCASTRDGKDIVALGASNGSIWVLDDLSAARETPSAAESGKRKQADVADLTAKHVGVTSTDLSVSSVRWHGANLLSAGFDGMVRVWDTQSSTVQSSIPGGGKAILGLEESSASFLVASADGVVRSLDPRDGKGVVSATGREKCHSGMATDVTWIVQDASFASSGLDGSVRAWDMRALAAPMHVVDSVHGKNGRSLALGCGSHDGRQILFSAGEDGNVQNVAFRL